MKKFLTGIFCVLFCVTSIFAQGTVDVSNALEKSAKEIASTLPEGSRVAVATFFSDSKEMTSYLSQEMVRRLTQKEKLTMIERNEKNMSLIDIETEYQYSGNVSDDSMVEIGYKLGAQYLVYGAFDQFGGMMQLTVQVTNVETSEIPYMTSYSISKTAQITDLLGEDINLVTSDDYLDAIARCQKKLTAIEKDKSKAIQNQKSKIFSTYQTQINKTKAQEQDPWESKEEYNKRISDEVSQIEKKRDTEVSGVEKSVSINYDSQTKQIEIQLDKLKKDLQNTTFVLNGDSVQVLVGAFNREEKPKNWPVSIKSLDKKITYTYNGKYTVNDADVKTEYTLIEEIRKNNSFAGEINYKIAESSVKNSFTVFIVNVRLYNSDTGITILNEQINKSAGNLDISSRAVGAAANTTKTTKTTVKEKKTSVSTSTDSVSSYAGTDDSFDEVNRLIKKNLFKNQGRILELSSSLSFQQKTMLYDDYKKSGTKAFWNLLPFGVGSFMQKDIGNACVIAGLDVIGLYLLFAGSDDLDYYANLAADARQEGHDSDAQKYEMQASDSETMMMAGLCIFAATQIYAFIRPWIFANKYNKKLTACLDMNSGSIGFVPIINPINDQYGFAISLAL